MVARRGRPSAPSAVRTGNLHLYVAVHKTGSEDEGTDVFALDDGSLGSAGDALMAQAGQARATARHRAESEALRARTEELHSTVAQAQSDGRQVVFILREDPELAQSLPPEQRSILAGRLRARCERLGRGPWKPQELGPTSYGLLVLDGLLARRVRIGRGASAELLGAGDILRPWDNGEDWNLPAMDVAWTVLHEGRVAVLDEGVTRAIGAHPELMVALASRLLHRSRSAARMAAITHITRVDERLLAWLWHVAERWGQVTPHGVRIPFRLTHELMAEAVGAQRPSVTVAIRQLAERDEAVRERGGSYVLTGEPVHWPA